MKRGILVIVLFGLSGLLLSLGWGERRPHVSDNLPRIPPDTAHPEDNSNPRIARLDCDHEPLRHVIQRLTDSMNLNIVVDWPALDGTVKLDTLVDAHLRDVRVTAALDAILRPTRNGPIDPFRRGILAYVQYLQEHDLDGRIRYYDELSGRLIITASPEMQARIWDLLHQLEDSIPNPAGGAAASRPSTAREDR